MAWVAKTGVRRGGVTAYPSSMVEAFRLFPVGRRQENFSMNFFGSYEALDTYCRKKFKTWDRRF
jgi:hypothetical protein